MQETYTEINYEREETATGNYTEVKQRETLYNQGHVNIGLCQP